MIDDQIAFNNTKETVKVWMQQRIARELGVNPIEIDPLCTFTNYHLDSIVLVTMANDLADWIGRDIDPTIFWEYENIEVLSNWIVESHSGK